VSSSTGRRKGTANGWNGHVELKEPRTEEQETSKQILKLVDKNREFEYEWPALNDTVYVTPTKIEPRQSKIYE